MTPEWRKASASGGTGCVEVAQDERAVLVRDSKRPDDGHLTVTRAAWREFLAFARRP